MKETPCPSRCGPAARWDAPGGGGLMEGLGQGIQAVAVHESTCQPKARNLSARGPHSSLHRWEPSN